MEDDSIRFDSEESKREFMDTGWTQKGMHFKWNREITKEGLGPSEVNPAWEKATIKISFPLYLAVRAKFKLLNDA